MQIIYIQWLNRNTEKSMKKNICLLETLITLTQ